MRRKQQPEVESWRSKLADGDEAEVIGWILQSGLDRVARIVSVLASGGRPGRIDQADSEALLQMARVKGAGKQRGNHSIASEVARSRSSSPMVLPENLVRKLRDDFNEQQHKWMWLAGQAAADYPRGAGHNTRRSPIEARALGRMIEMLPEELNLYSWLLTDAEKLGQDKVSVVQKLGRKKGEALLAKRLKEQMDGTSKRPANKPPPRSMFDLIADDLC